MTTPTKELSMYGCNIERYKEQVKSDLTYKFVGGAMSVASILSDAQELMAMGDTESARQLLNRAKALLFDALEGKFDMTVNIPERK